MKAALLVLGLVAAATGGAFVYARLAGELAREQEARRAAQQALLEAEGITTSHRVTIDILQVERDRLAGEIPALKSALERLQKAAPKARVVAVETMTTGPIEVVSPRPPEPAGAAPLVPALAIGDRLELRMGRVQVETEEGVLALVAAAQAVAFPPDEGRVLVSKELRGRSLVPAVAPACAGGGGAPWWSLAAACAVCGGAAAVYTARR